MDRAGPDRLPDAGGLEAIEPWIEGYLRKLIPGERTKVARKIGIMLRRANSERIRANVEPDGGAMEPRKPKKHGRKKGKMFRKTGKLKNLRLRPTSEGVTIDFARLVAGAAAVHHFGLIDKVDKTIPNSIKVRYPPRRLLGFSQADRDAIMDEVIRWVGD